MFIHHLNIAVITWSNFEAGIDINGIIMGVIELNASIDVVDVSTGVNVAVVMLREGSVGHFEHWASSTASPLVTARVRAVTIAGHTPPTRFPSEPL